MSRSDRVAATGAVVLDDGEVRLEIARLGAELASLRRSRADLEYCWHGDERWWGRRAPVLFPIVGRLRGDRYRYGGREYTLGQHGFARDREFGLAAHDGSTATFVLAADTGSRAIYPFGFRLEVAYRVGGGCVEVALRVDNVGDRELPFSIGGHPGFNCPLVPGERTEDYEIAFETEETAPRLLIADGLVTGATAPCLAGTRVLPLAPGLFDRGALVFAGLCSRRVTLRSRVSGHGVELAFPGFPYLGIWSKPGAPFVCLEPWCGVADRVDASGRLEDKEGIVRQAPGTTFARTFVIRPF